MKAVGAAVATGLVAPVVALAVAQLLPAASSWRCLRNRYAPRLAGVGDAKHLALTFDDGPHPVSTPAFLDALDALGWRATFFMLG
jgi:peptidoglycan/xylan/chitin deacetylase (PgdA/CDA1 family)